MWRYKYNNDANGYYHQWFEVTDINGHEIVRTPNAKSDDETNAILISSLSHFHSVLMWLKRCYSTEFIEWLEQHPCDWDLVTMLVTESVHCRQCEKGIGTIQFGNMDIIHSLKLCAELAICGECRQNETE